MDKEIKDITSLSMEEIVDLEEITQPSLLLKTKMATPARIGIGHTGARYKTTSVLRFLAAQAAASTENT